MPYSHSTVRKTRLWCCSALVCVCWEGELWEQQPITCPGYLVIFTVLRTQNVSVCVLLCRSNINRDWFLKIPLSLMFQNVFMVVMLHPVYSKNNLVKADWFLLSIPAIWSLSFMDFMHYLKEISASRQCGTSGSLQTWNCSGKLWCLESECLLNYTRWDAGNGFCCQYFIVDQTDHSVFTWLVRTTSHPPMSMTSQLFFMRPSPRTSRTWSLLTKATQHGGVLFCPMPHHSSPCATSWMKAPMSTKLLC